jgi:hypothetical protein
MLKSKSRHTFRYSDLGSVSPLNRGKERFVVHLDTSKHSIPLASHILHADSTSRGNGIVSDILHRTFGPEFQKQDRPLRLTYMTLRKFIGTSMLSDCKEYWEHHSALITCFADLRPFVQDLQGSDQREFYEFVRSHASATGQELGSNQVTSDLILVAEYADVYTVQDHGRRLAHHPTERPQVLISSDNRAPTDTRWFLKSGGPDGSNFRVGD